MRRLVSARKKKKKRVDRSLTFCYFFLFLNTFARCYVDNCERERLLFTLVKYLKIIGGNNNVLKKI